MHDLPASSVSTFSRTPKLYLFASRRRPHDFLDYGIEGHPLPTGSKAELHNVKIISFGRNSDRMDESLAMISSTTPKAAT